MIDRICISINNRCNLACSYCHFHEKAKSIHANDMNVFEILDHVKSYADGGKFRIGFVGNGEALLDWSVLKSYIAYLDDSPNVKKYSITNGTIRLPEEELLFLEERKVNLGFSIDGPKELHDKYRCNSFDTAMANVEHYRTVTGHYPTFNSTVGREIIENADKVIRFFQPFGTRVTFSRMIGRFGISLDEYRDFLNLAEESIPVRRGENDCTMYGGNCGSGINNYFFANGQVFFCGNCIDLPPVGSSSMTFEELEGIRLDFDRTRCYKESFA